MALGAEAITALASIDMLLSSDLFAVSAETNAEVEGMKASNVASRIVLAPAPFAYKDFRAVLDRHRMQIAALKADAKRRRERLIQELAR